MSIFPSTLAGGVPPTDGRVENGYVPPESFSLTCDLTYLPSDCTARITPAQINTFSSEMLCFAASLNPDGEWNCDSLCNIANNFNAWKTGVYTGSLKNIIANFICSSPTVPEPNIATASFVGCDGSGNLFKTVLSDFLSIDVIGPILCDSDVGSPDAGSLFLYCDGEGNVKKGEIPGAGDSECGCPPFEILGVPTAPPTLTGPESSPFRIDVTDVNNRDGYYWSETDVTWRPIHANKISRKIGRADLKASDPLKESYFWLEDGPRSGRFRAVIGDFTTAFAYDTLEGVFIKLDAYPINQIALVREHNGVVTPRMFGALGNGVTNDRTAVQRAWWTSAFLRAECDMEGLEYNCNEAVFTASNLRVKGNGAVMYLTAWPTIGGFVNNVCTSGTPWNPDPYLSRIQRNIIIDDLVFDGSKIPAPVVGQQNNSNLFDFGWGASDSTVQNCTFRYMREGTGMGTGGAGFGGEQGLTNILFLNNRVIGCFRGMRFAGVDQTHVNGGQSKRCAGILVRNTYFEDCGCVLFAHSVTEPITSHDDLRVFDVDIDGIRYHNCGHQPWTFIDYAVFPTIQPQKSGVLVFARAENIRVRNVAGQNDNDYTTTFVDWLGRSGYPAAGTNTVGAGLSGPIGAVVWGNGRNIKLENIDYYGNSDTIQMFGRAVALGEIATGALTDCLNFEIDGFRHPFGSSATIVDAFSSSQGDAGIVARLLNMNFDVAQTTGLIATNAQALTNITLEIVRGGGAVMRGTAAQLNASGWTLATNPQDYNLAGSLRVNGVVDTRGTITVNGGYDSAGSRDGLTVSTTGLLRQSVDSTASKILSAFYDPNGFAAQDAMQGGFRRLGLRGGVAGQFITGGAGTPEGAITAGPGSLYLRNDGGVGTRMYFKATGTGNTGWLPVTGV